jgi:hypothetical protein
MTWTAAQDVASWRCPDPTEGEVMLYSCNGVNLARVVYIDAGEELYYDAAGNLYRVESLINVTQHCAAGSGQVLSSMAFLSCDDPDARTLCGAP